MRFHSRVIRIPALLFLSGYPVVAQQFEIGVKGGLRATDDISGSVIFSATPESKRYIVGPMLGVGLPLRFSFEFDALYRRFGFTSRFNSPFPGYSSFARVRANSWEFPMTLKYRLPFVLVHPFVGVGYAPRTIHGSDVSSSEYLSGNFRTRGILVTHGLVVSGGVAVGAGHVRVSPELRYVHWSPPFLNYSGPSYQLVSTQHELFVLLGVSLH